MEVKPLQSEKQYSPSEVTDEGIFMDVKPLQPEKHQPLNEVIDEVISMDFNPLHEKYLLSVDYQCYTL